MSLPYDVVIDAALEAGFMVSTQYGQTEGKRMPVADHATLKAFALLIEKRVIEEQL